jgi:hypothetical protein
MTKVKGLERRTLLLEDMKIRTRYWELKGKAENQKVGNCSLLYQKNGPNTIRSKTVITNVILEHLKYPGDMISYRIELDMKYKLKIVIKVTGIIINIFKPKEN